MCWELIQLSFSQLNFAPALFISDNSKISEISSMESISFSEVFDDHLKKPCSLLVPPGDIPYP